jgi:ABC-type dipeptide/oligopeptide/nickel transport system permease subunit
MSVERFRNSDLWRFARRRPTMLFGFAVIVINLFLAFFGQAIAPYPVEAPAGASLLPPAGGHWFGTDVLWSVERTSCSGVVFSLRTAAMMALRSAGVNLSFPDIGPRTEAAGCQRPLAAQCQATVTIPHCQPGC